MKSPCPCYRAAAMARALISSFSCGALRQVVIAITGFGKFKGVGENPTERCLSFVRVAKLGCVEIVV